MRPYFGHTGTFRPGPAANSKPLATIDVIYSPDDGGWYAEIYGQLGQDLHTTELADDRDMAAAEAEDWAAKNEYRVTYR